MAEEKKAYILDKEGKDTGEAVGPDTGYLKWALRQGAIGIGDTPGSFAALYGLGGAVKDYLWDRVDPTVTPEKGFVQNMFDPEGGEEKLKAYNANVVEAIKRARPTAPPEEIQKRFDEITKHSKKYYEETTPFYRPGLAFARRWGQGTNEFFGDPRLPTEKTQADTLANIAGGAIPIPGGGAVTSAVAQGAGKVIGKTAGRVAANVVEAATPLTLVPRGATLGEAATRTGFNVAIPEAVDQASRMYRGEPSVVKEVFTKDDGSADATAVGAVGVLGTLLAARKLRNMTTASVHTPSAGPSAQSMTQAGLPTVDPLKMKVAQAGSDVEPFNVMFKRGGLEQDEIDAVMTNMRMNAGGMPTADHRIWYNQKVSPIVEQFVREDPKFIEKYLQHSADSNRIWGDTEAITETSRLLAEAQTKLNKATTSGRSPPATIQKLTDEVNNLTAERNARLNDADPNLRYSALNDDTATVMARLNQSRADPKIRAMDNHLYRLYDDIFDEAVKNNGMTAREAAKLKLEVRKGNYHLTDNPLANKPWMERTKYNMMKSTESHLVNVDPHAALTLYRMANRTPTRKGYASPLGETRYVNPQAGDVPHPRVNNPRDPLSELNHISVRTRQATSHNRAMEAYTTAMVNARNNADGRLLSIVDRITERELPSKIFALEKLLDNNKGPKYHYAYRSAEGDIVVVRHNEKAIQEALKFSPASVVPIMNQTRKLLQSFTTGELNPKFGLATSNPFDVLGGSLLRHPLMSYGPLSRNTSRIFGMGHPVARTINAIMAGPESVHNLFVAYPYTALKSLTVELFGNQIAKRWQNDLAKNSGTIGALARMPGGAALIGKVADIMSKAYETSWVNLTKTMKVGQVSAYSDELLSRMKQIDTITKKRPEVKAWANGYRDILSTLLDVPKQMALSQNLKLYNREVRKGRVQAKQLNELFIADQSRMIGGDMARFSLLPNIQKAASSVPWLNTSIQSLRYLKQRIWENPVENLTRLTSFGLTASWAYYMIANDKEGNDWFFNQLPSDKRAQSVPMPDPYKYIMRQAGVNIPRGKPEEEYFLVRMPPEMMMFIMPVIHGMRALGLIPNKDVVVPPELGEDMQQAASQVFGLSVPPLIQAPAAAFGKQIEPAKIIKGESPFRDIRDRTFGGANKDKMSPQSRIPHAFHDVFNALFGTTAGTILEAANYGDIIANGPGGSLPKGVTEGVKKFATSQAVDTPGLSHIWPDMNRRYIYTPTAEKRQKDMAVLKAIDGQMGNEPGLRRALPHHGAGGRVNMPEMTGAEPGAVVGAPVTDPDLQALMFHNRVAFFSGPYKKLEEQRRVERNQHEAMTIGADPNKKESPLMRFRAAQEQAKKVNALDHQLYTIYQDQWKQMVASPSGIAFQKKYGPLTPENLLKAIQQSAREGGQRPKPQMAP